MVEKTKEATVADFTNPDATRAKEKILAVFGEAIPGLEAKHISFSPYADPEAPEGKRERTAIYLSDITRHLKMPGRADLQRLAARLDASAEPSAPTQISSKQPVSLYFHGTMKQLAALDEEKFRQPVSDMDLIKKLLHPILAKIFTDLETNEIDVTADNGHVSISVDGRHRFTGGRPQIRRLADAVENALPDILLNFNGSSMAQDAADGGKIRIEYEGGIQKLLEADWQQVDAALSDARRVETYRG